MPLTRKLSESTVVVTGASSGIGAATAHALARRGVSVVLTARSEPALQAVAEECRSLGGQALVTPANVTDPHDVERVAAHAEAEFGRIDAWVNNAAVTAVGLFTEIPVADLRLVIEVNLLGVAYGMRSALPRLRAAGGGVLVNNASILGEVAMPYQSAYNAAKHGVRGLSDTVRQELRVTAETGISICTLLPAAVDTAFFGHATNHTGHRLASPPPVHPPEAVARAIVRLLRHPRREAYVGRAARLLGLQWRLAPGLTERMLGRYARRGQPRGAGGGVLFRPSMGGWADRGLPGRRRRTVRAGVLGLVAGTAAGAAAAVARRALRERWRVPD